MLLLVAPTPRVPPDDRAERNRVERLLDEFNEPLGQEFLAPTGMLSMPLPRATASTSRTNCSPSMGHRDIRHQHVRSESPQHT